MYLALAAVFTIVAAPCSSAECTGFADPSSPSAQRIAQVQLAEALAAADSIDAIHAAGHVVTFTIDIAGEAFAIIASTGSRGEVTSLAVADRGHGPAERGELSWLAGELADSIAITALSVGDHGTVKLRTTDGRTYLATPIRDLGGNGAVEARWAAAWD